MSPSVAGLDPETDYERIVSLIANYKLNDFVMNLNYATGFMANTVPPGGSDRTRVFRFVHKPRLKAGQYCRIGNRTVRACPNRAACMVLAATVARQTRTQQRVEAAGRITAITATNSTGMVLANAAEGGEQTK